MLNQANLYHIGVVVDDFQAAMDRYGRQMGVTWSPLINVTVRIWTRDHGEMELHSHAIYSQQEPCIELVKTLPGTFWVPTEGRPLHHLGYWVDDLPAASADLEARGCPKIACALREGAMMGFAYHEMKDGPYIEMVDRAVFPDWPAFLAGRMQHEVIHKD